MINTLSVGDKLIINDEEYEIKRVYSDSTFKTTYLVKSGSYHYFIKEFLPVDDYLLNRTVRDKTTCQAVFEEGFTPEKASVVYNDGEILAYENGIQESENNNSFIFPAWQLVSEIPQCAAIYLKVYSVSGNTFDRFLSDTKWRENKTEQELLSFVIDLAEKTAEALSSLHNKGLIHGDIKLQNLYRCNDGSVKLIDLGSSIPVEKEKRGDRVFVQSTIDYLSNLLIEITSEGMLPSNDSSRLKELIMGLSVKEDIFALAMVITFLITGSEFDTEIKLKNKVLYSELMRILDNATYAGSVTIGSGEEFDTGVYESCDEFREELRKLLNIINSSCLHEAVVLNRGKQLFTEGFVNELGIVIDEELIPEIERKE